MRSAVLADLLDLCDSGVWGNEEPASGMSVLRSTNFRNDGTLNFENLALRAIEPAKRVSKLLSRGDLLLEKSGGGPSQPVGRVVLFNGDGLPHTFGNFIARLGRSPSSSASTFGTTFATFIAWARQVTTKNKQPGFAISNSNATFRSRCHFASLTNNAASSTYSHAPKASSACAAKLSKRPPS